MNELRLHVLNCPQCGAPGLVREGTRITDCDRCGATLCLTQVVTPRYEAAANLSVAEAITRARDWLNRKRQEGTFGRPELVLIPYHEISGRRIGVFHRKVPERKRVHRTVYSSKSGGPDVESKFVYSEKADVKVMISDVQSLTPAAHTPWDLKMFDAESARRTAELSSFDLVEAQRRATVYAEELTPSATAVQRYAEGGGADIVGAARRTIFFPFWSIPIESAAGSFQIVIEALSGDVVAWRLPRSFPSINLEWALLALLGALGLGQLLHRVLFGAAVVSPALALIVGAAATGAALWRSNRPDWSLNFWPKADTIPRLERRGSR